MDAYAGVYARDGGGAAPLRWTADCGSLEVCWLSNQVWVNETMKPAQNESYPKRIGLGKMKSEQPIDIMDTGADVEARGGKGATPLHRSANCGSSKVVVVEQQR